MLPSTLIYPHRAGDICALAESCFCTRLESAADRAFGAQRISVGRTERRFAPLSGGRTGRRFAPLSGGAALRAAWGRSDRAATTDPQQTLNKHLSNPQQAFGKPVAHLQQICSKPSTNLTLQQTLREPSADPEHALIFLPPSRPPPQSPPQYPS